MLIIFIIYDYDVEKKTLKIYKYENTSFFFIQRKFQTKIYLGMKFFIDPKANPPIGWNHGNMYNSMSLAVYLSS